MGKVNTFTTKKVNTFRRLKNGPKNLLLKSLEGDTKILRRKGVAVEGQPTEDGRRRSGQ